MEPHAGVPILIRDMHCVHMMGSIVNPIQSLGIEVMHIRQRVDVGINKSIKSVMRNKGED